MYLAAASSAYGRPKRRPSARRERDVPTSAERPDVDLVPFVATVRWQEYGVGLPEQRGSSVPALEPNLILGLASRPASTYGLSRARFPRGSPTSCDPGSG